LLDFAVAAECIESDSGERGAHFEAAEAGLTRGLLTVSEDLGAESSPGERGMHEDGADLAASI